MLCIQLQCHDESVYPKIESGYAFTKDLHDELVSAFKNRSLTKDSGSLGIKNHNPEDLVLHHVPVKEKAGKVEVIRLRIGCITDTFTSVGIQEIVEIGGKVFPIFDGIIFEGNFKVYPFKNFLKIVQI